MATKAPPACRDDARNWLSRISKRTWGSRAPIYIPFDREMLELTKMNSLGDYAMMQ